MLRDTVAAFVLRGLGAALWLAVAWLAARQGGLVFAGPFLFVAGLPGIAAGFAAIGWTQFALREGSRLARAGATDRFARMARQVMAATFRDGLPVAALVALMAVHGGTAISFGASAIGLILLAVACLAAAIGNGLAALLRARGQIARAMFWTGPARALAGAGALAALVVAPEDGRIAAAVFAALHAVALLALLPGSGLFARRRASEPGQAPSAARVLRMNGLAWVALSQGDIVLAGLLLAPDETGLYIVVRRLAGLAWLAAEACRVAVAPHIAAEAAATVESFRAVAAQAGRLSHLAIGLAVAATGLCAPLLLPPLGAPAGGYLLAVFLATALIPAFFGATGMLMAMGDQAGLRAALTFGALLLAVAGALAAAPTALTLAGLFLMAHLSLAAASAAALWHRHGIRPRMVQMIWRSGPRR